MMIVQGYKTKEEKENMEYIKEHVQNVQKAYKEYGALLSSCLELDPEDLTLEILIANHDKSKFSSEEFESYRKRFFPMEGEKTDPESFNAAWLHHIHSNPHHPEHWVLQNYNKETHSFYAIPIEMPKVYLAEMLCDWIAMGYKFGDMPYQYYAKNSGKYQLHKNTEELLIRCINELYIYDLKHNKI